MNDKARILVVEDEGIVALDLDRQLAKLGYETVAVTNTAEKAIELAERLRPRLVLMDIHLAGAMDGIEGAMQLRERFSIPSVFLTAYATDDVVERAKAAEPLGYVIKPFDEYALRTSIEIALHKDHSDRLLRESQARYRAVINASDDAIVTINSEGTIVGWSPGATRMLGYAEGVALGLPSTLFVVGDDMTRMWSADAPAPVSGEIRARRSDGMEFPIERSLARWETADGWRVTAFIRDITSRVRFEKNLRLQAAALRAAANAIVISDRTGAIEWVNPAFTALTGYSAADAVGHNPRDLVKSGAHDAAFYDGLWETIAGGRVWEGELVNRRKDGSTYPELQTITPVKDARGVITHFIAIKRDLTKEKGLQEQLLQAQKMEVLGRLAGGIAHDFNNLLTVINGESDLALSELPEGHALKEPLGNILDAGSRAARLTAQLLAFSRKQVVSPAVVAVGTQVDAVAPMIRRLIGEDIALSIDMSEAAAAARVRIDRGQFEQVMLNLAVNARDAMPGGGALTIRARAADAHIVIEVIDTGQGIAHEIQSRIFEPFFTTKSHGKGTGLGLATVYSIVSQNGGTLDVESAPGCGATFIIRLPQSTAECAPEDQQRPLSGGTETIVLVEDEDGIRQLTARMLRSMGYSVIEMASSPEALEWLRTSERPVHLLLSDVVMPGLTGPELAAAIAPIRPRLPVLYVSGYADDKLAAELIADPDRFLAKPYQHAALSEKVRRILDSVAVV